MCYGKGGYIQTANVYGIIANPDAMHIYTKGDQKIFMEMLNDQINGSQSKDIVYQYEAIHIFNRLIDNTHFPQSCWV